MVDPWILFIVTPPHSQTLKVRIWILDTLDMPYGLRMLPRQQSLFRSSPLRPRCKRRSLTIPTKALWLKRV